jgi:transketolase
MTPQYASWTPPSLVQASDAIRMRTAFIDRLFEIASKDPRVMLVVGDLGFGVVTRFMTELPKQFVNAGVAEQNMTGLAAGLALSGRVVFTYSIANFPILRCLEQLRNDICYHEANVKVVAVGGGLSYGALGVSHHATEDLAVARAIPNLTVLAPNDPFETAEATRMLAATDGPAYMRIDRGGSKVEVDDPAPFAIGKARLARDGTDLAILATGGLLSTALGAAEELARVGLSARVLSMHTIHPLDIDAVLAAARTGAVFTLEEHSVTGGLGGAVAEVLMEGGAAGTRFKRLGLPPAFTMAIGDQAFLRREHALDVAGVTASVQAVLRT